MKLNHPINVDRVRGLRRLGTHLGGLAVETKRVPSGNKMSRGNFADRIRQDTLIGASRDHIARFHPAKREINCAWASVEMSLPKRELL